MFLNERKIRQLRKFLLQRLRHKYGHFSASPSSGYRIHCRFNELNQYLDGQEFVTQTDFKPLFYLFFLMIVTNAKFNRCALYAVQFTAMHWYKNQMVKLTD